MILKAILKINPNAEVSVEADDINLGRDKWINYGVP